MDWDKIYYAAILSILTGLIVWSIRAFVGKAIEAMASEIKYVGEGVQRVEKGLEKKTDELKQHFNAACTERQAACSKTVFGRVEKLEKHGHRGLEGEGNRHTY